MKHHAHVALFRFDEKIFIRRHQTLVAQMNLAAVRFFQTADHAQGRRLAATARAQHGEKLALGDVYINPIDGGDLAESLIEILNA
jgi:hypothetical protein